MKKVCWLMCAWFLVSACDDELVFPRIGPQDLPRVDDITVPDGFIVEEFASNIELPTGIAFPPDGSDRLFVNELQSGKIWIYEEGERLDTPFYDLALNIQGGFPVSGENGMIGLEFDPDYVNNGYLYITYASRNENTIGTVARITDRNNSGEEFTVLLTDLPSDRGHQIENARFGPDGKLYVSVGDAYQEQYVQDPERAHGKILRMNPDGTIPADNPFGPDNYVYAIGFRNAFDMLFLDNGDLLATDNGPTGMDKMMVVEAGGNYGWPDELGFNDNPEFTNPIHVWTETVSPTGMVKTRGSQFPAAYRNKVYQVLFGFTFSSGPNTNGKRVQIAELSGQGQNTTVTFTDFAVWQFEGTPNNPVDIAEGPDGSLYVSDIFQGKIFRIRHAP
ncbi:MAG: PQQ-dependent sugar dehydrogenase [Balneolaceae bacterium]